MGVSQGKWPTQVPVNSTKKNACEPYGEGLSWRCSVMECHIRVELGAIYQ